MTEEESLRVQVASRIVAEQVCEQVLATLAQRHPEIKQLSPGEKLLAWLPLLIAVATAFWTLAIQSKQVEQNRLDIAKLETRFDQSAGVMQSVDSRLASIETTLDIITGRGRKNELE